MLYSHFSQNCIFLYFSEAKNPCFVTKNCSKSSYICIFILSKKQHNWFYKNLHNSGMVGRRKLPDLSLNCIFNALSTGVQYTLSFQWTNFGLKCLFLLFTIHRLQQLPKEESNVLNTLDNIWQPKNDVVSPKQTVFVFPIKKEF